MLEFLKSRMLSKKLGSDTAETYGLYRRARLIAHYLPQFHPIPENDEWWGRGFTEWTNVTKAKPLFEGHYQPILPADLGFYDLRMPEVRIAQAKLAREYGIEAFCYWHYWFAGKRLLERPFNEVLKSGKPDFPFCLGWANDTWTGIWHGCADKILIEQTYPGPEDEEAHFYALLEAFCDRRYLKIDHKPAFLIYKPYMLPDPNRFLDHWRTLAVKNGLKGIYFIGNARTMGWAPEKDGFDGLTPHNPGLTAYDVFYPPEGLVKNVWEQRFPGKTFTNPYLKHYPGPELMLYEDYIKIGLPSLRKDFDEFPCVIPNWDNTARCGKQGWVFLDSTPELFRIHLREAIEQVSHRPPDKRLVFVKSWNEWAEGNYLEPDQKYGRGYLEACRDEVFGMSKYVYHPSIKHTDFARSVEIISNRGYKVKTEIPSSASNLFDQLIECNMVINNYMIDIEQFNHYINQAGYLFRYKDYYPSNFAEKTLEHYICINLLNLQKNDVLIDIASKCSPLPEICTSIYGLKSFSQDIMYEQGINDNRIGGDACNMPVPDGFASKAVLTCSLEHFEGDADTRLFRELCRILKPGGVVCVIPFYLHTDAFTITDPTISAPSLVNFDKENVVYCAEGWNKRHGRHYSPKSFTTRIIDNVQNKFKFNYYHLMNAKEIDLGVYARFAFTATRL